MRLLVVEDEPAMGRALQNGLQEDGHAVIVSSEGHEALAMALQCPFDAIVLDVMLPGLDGFVITERLRASRITTPILMLTAKDAVQDIVRGLNTGADDYLTKPFSFAVLLARIRALSRREKDARSPMLAVGSLWLDSASREVTRSGRRIRLTKTEFTFLELLMGRAGQVMTREMILDRVWGFDRTVESNTIDVFVRLLRNKIDGDGEPKLIHNVWGVGYVMREVQE